MAFKLKKAELVEEGLRRIAVQQIDKATTELVDRQLSQSEKVHQVRKRCKKLRGLIRAVAPALGKQYHTENVWLRDTARLLSPLRDAKTSLQTFDALIAQAGGPGRTFDSIRQRFDVQAKELTGRKQEIKLQLRTVRDRLEEARARSRDWSLDEDGFSALRGGIKKTYAKARKIMRQAREGPSAEILHAWRKQVKYHAYQCRVLQGMWPEMVASRGRQAGELGDWLGEDHDLAVIRDQVLQNPDRYGRSEDISAFVQLTDQRRGKLQQKCWVGGARLFAEGKRAFVRRYARYWDIWRAG